jgi:hypothetical protein
LLFAVLQTHLNIVVGKGIDFLPPQALTAKTENGFELALYTV